jgi:hypothetical protein
MAETFIISWDQLGVECVFNATEADRQVTFDILAGTYDGDNNRSHNPNSLLNMLVLRARYNPQRHYEIYAIDVEDGITATDIKQMFNNDPQGSADLIRERGRNIFSDRANKQHIKIT